MVGGGRLTDNRHPSVQVHRWELSKHQVSLACALSLGWDSCSKNDPFFYKLWVRGGGRVLHYENSRGRNIQSNPVYDEDDRELAESLHSVIDQWIQYNLRKQFTVYTKFMKTKRDYQHRQEDHLGCSFSQCACFGLMNINIRNIKYKTLKARNACFNTIGAQPTWTWVGTRRGRPKTAPTHPSQRLMTRNR